MRLDTELFIDLIQKAIEEHKNDKLWELYQQEYLIARFTGNHLMSFEDYKKPKKQETKSDDEILKDAEDILKMLSPKK